MIKGFKDFLLRGNVVDLAVAVVIGVAFGAVVAAFLKGIITPLVAAIFGKPDLTGVGAFTINHANFSIGLVLDALLNFVIIAAVIYFFVVVPVNALMARRKAGIEGEVESPSEDIVLLQEIRDLLSQRSSL